MKHGRRLAAALMLATLTASCATYRTLAVSRTPTQRGERAWDSKRTRVTAYMTTDHVQHSFSGFVEASGESVRFVRPYVRERGLERGDPGEVRPMARDSVDSVRAEYRHTAASAIVASVVFLSLALVGEAMSFSLW